MIGILKYHLKNLYDYRGDNMITEIAGYIGKTKHLKDKSYYNHNYYEIIEQSEFFSCNEECSIIYEECEDDNLFMYHFGYFDNNGKYVSMIAIESNKDWKLGE